MEIIEYNPEYKDKFIEFNCDWIVENFGSVEKGDEETFSSIEQFIKNGSMIFMAVRAGNLLAGCMAKKDNNNEWEICKLCSNKHMEHKGAGSAVFEACVDYAVKNGAKRIYIISNSKLKAALHIYEKFGFKQIEMGDYHYDRGNIAFELNVQSCLSTP